MAEAAPIDPEARIDTRTLVFEAAEEMLRDGQGHAITQRSIYEAIGNRGSMTTIQRALREWWMKIGDHVIQLEYLHGFPPEALSPLLQVFEEIRTVAHEQAHAEYEEAVDEAREAIASANAEREDALQAKENAQDEIVTLNRQVDQLVEQRDGLDRQLRAECSRRKALEQEIPAIREDARVRIEQAERRTEGLQAALTKEEARYQATETRLTTLYDQERTARAQEHAQAESTQRALQGKLEEANQTYLQAKQEGAQLTSQLREDVARLTGQIDQLKTAEQQLQAQLVAGQSERAELAASLTEAQADRRHDQARIRDLEQRYATLESTCEAKDQEILQLTKQVAGWRDTQES